MGKAQSPMSGHPLLVFEGHDNAVTCFLQVSDGSIVSGSMDTTRRHWDVQSGECLRVMLGHVKSVTALLELRDGRIASSSLDHTIRLWDLQHGEGQVLRVMEGHGHYGVTCLCQLADGRLLSGGEDTRVMVWELDKVEDSTYTPAILGFNDSVKEMHDGHRHSVCCITQLADGRVATGGGDGWVNIWNVNAMNWNLPAGTGALECKLEKTKMVIQLKDGTLAGSSYDSRNALWIWNIPPPQEPDQEPDEPPVVTRKFLGTKDLIHMLIELLLLLSQIEQPRVK